MVCSSAFSLAGCALQVFAARVSTGRKKKQNNPRQLVRSPRLALPCFSVGLPGTTSDFSTLTLPSLLSLPVTPYEIFLYLLLLMHGMGWTHQHITRSSHTEVVRVPISTSPEDVTVAAQPRPVCLARVVACSRSSCKPLGKVFTRGCFFGISLKRPQWHHFLASFREELASPGTSK